MKTVFRKINLAEKCKSCLMHIARYTMGTMNTSYWLSYYSQFLGVHFIENILADSLGYNCTKNQLYVWLIIYNRNDIIVPLVLKCFKASYIFLQYFFFSSYIPNQVQATRSQGLYLTHFLIFIGPPVLILKKAGVWEILGISIDFTGNILGTW